MQALWQLTDLGHKHNIHGLLFVVQVKVKLREVLEWNLPELTLEICKSVKDDVESIEQFQNDLREAVRLEAAEELQVGASSFLDCCNGQ